MTRKAARFHSLGEKSGLTTAAGVPGFIGFAVGRTTFWEPLVNWRRNAITREAAVAEVARRYRGWVPLFEAARRG
ncbi:MAG TPA: DUF2090 domain-containing protein [Isosphaeraceae bacterium]|nr:DUF2090 domain-containing protein [Isosphaeraceae bacterium]